MTEPQNNFLKILHYLSLDVVLGAVLSSSMFWKIPNGNTAINLPALLILGVCTWIIYIFDRLLDNLTTTPEYARHHFHFQYQYLLQTGIVMLLFIAVILLFFLSNRIIYFGIVLLILIIGYFYLLHKKSKSSSYQYIKEIFSSIIYSLAVVGTAFVTKLDLILENYLLGFLFFLLVHQSVLIFSFYELKLSPKTKNYAKKIGNKNCTYLIVGIFIIVFFTNFFISQSFLEKIVLVETLMAFCSTLIYFFHKTLTKNERYRWLGEMVFFLPSILIFF